MNKFAQTCAWTNCTAQLLTTASHSLIEPHFSGELDKNEKAYSRLLEIRERIWGIREELLAVRDALNFNVGEADYLGYTPKKEVAKLLIEFGLMSEEEVGKLPTEETEEIPF